MKKDGAKDNYRRFLEDLRGERAGAPKGQPNLLLLMKSRAFLRKEITKSIDDIDIEHLKLCCYHLFKNGKIDDVLLIWNAKESSFDAHCSIDVQFLCGQGLEETKQHLTGLESPEAKEALEYLVECEATGDFEEFFPDTWAAIL